MKRILRFLLPIVMAHAIAAVALAQSSPLNQLPEVELLSPPDGAFIPGPTDILLAAQAFDADGLVVSVEFKVNGESVGFGQGITTPLFSFF